MPGFNPSTTRASAPTQGQGLSRPKPRLLSGLTLLVWILAILAAAAAASLMFPPGQWYESLAKPTWNPPSWLFGPVWTLLYILLGVSAWLVWREPGVEPGVHKWAWAAFATHAVLNLAWTPLFFGLREPALAFVDISLLWLSVLWLTMAFGRISPLAGYLLMPLVLWESFALLLNGTIWLMNA